MKNLLLFILIVAAGCSKHKDPGFTSAEGKWTYSTTDTKISVTFELIKASGGGLSIQNQTIKVDGTSGTAAAQISGVSVPAIQKIRINANDINLVYPYSIELDNGVLSSDFKTITFATATYIWPWPTPNSLTTVKVTRP